MVAMAANVDGERSRGGFSGVHAGVRGTVIILPRVEMKTLLLRRATLLGKELNAAILGLTGLAPCRRVTRELDGLLRAWRGMD